VHEDSGKILTHITYLHSVHLFMGKWKYTSIKFFEKELEIDHSTTVDWNNFMREVCADNLLKNSHVIGGPNYNVEKDIAAFWDSTK